MTGSRREKVFGAGRCGPLDRNAKVRIGTQDQVILGPVPTPAPDPNSPLERAQARFGAAVTGKLLPNEGGGTLGAT
jgi:hypothetical protein